MQKKHFRFAWISNIFRQLHSCVMPINVCIVCVCCVCSAKAAMTFDCVACESALTLNARLSLSLLPLSLPPPLLVLAPICSIQTTVVAPLSARSPTQTVGLPACPLVCFCNSLIYICIFTRRCRLRCCCSCWGYFIYFEYFVNFSLRFVVVFMQSFVAIQFRETTSIWQYRTCLSLINHN